MPLLTPRLSSLWLALVTDVDLATARTLIDSMTNEVVVHDTSIRDVVPGRDRWATTTRSGWRWPTGPATQAGTRRHDPPSASPDRRPRTRRTGAPAEGRPEAAGPRDAGR